MKSLRSVLIAWFLFFSLVPVLVVTFLLIRSFDSTYRRETEFRLVSVVQEIESRLISDQKFLLDSLVLWTAGSYLKPVLSSQGEKQASLILNLIKDRSIDSLAIYSRDGILRVSYQKDESGRWVPFPSLKSSQTFYLPKDQQRKVQASRPYFAIKTYPKRKVMFSIFQRIQNQNNIIVEVSKNIHLSDFDLMRSRRQVDLMLLDGNHRTILSNWVEAPSRLSFFKDLASSSDGLISRDIAGAEKLILLKKIKWGESDLILLAISPKQNWNEAISQVRFYVSMVLISITVILILAVFSVTSNIIDPLKNLLGVTRKILYENASVQLEAGPYDEITSLSQAIMELSRNIHIAQDQLLKKIEQLRETQGQLVQSEKLNSLGLLVAGIAHEINNPIGYIYSNIQPLKQHFVEIRAALEQQAKGALDPNLQYIFDDIPKLIQSFEDGSLRIKKIIEGLRTFSRHSADSSESVSVRQLLESTLVLLSHEIKARNIDVKTVMDSDFNVRGNMTELSQVLLNIMMNSVQAIGQKGQIHLRVTNGLLGQIPAVAIEIQDSGPGISREIQSRIFEPFYTTKSPGEGTGLGLSISYGIIQKHLGQIVVNSVEGEGAAFTVLLPLE